MAKKEQWDSLVETLNILKFWERKLNCLNSTKKQKQKIDSNKLFFSFKDDNDDADEENKKKNKNIICDLLEDNKLKWKISI